MTKTKEPKYSLKAGHQVQEVLIGGKKYFEFVDSNMAPCHRMFTAMAFYEELRMRCDREYLVAHTKKCIELNNADGVFNRTDNGNLLKQLLERLEWILEPETVYKYASVVFFDENENPYDYDMKYNQDVKIKRWKDDGISSFFLSMPVKRLFPLLNMSAEDLAVYLKVQEKVNEIHYRDIFTTLSKNK